MTMALERTFSILKPDCTARNLTGAVNAVIEKAGLRIVAQKRIHMTRDQAGTFYAVHKERPFFGELVDFITSGPIVALALEADGAVQTVRDMMGKTNPLESAPGTIRGDLALVLSENVIHGSDSPESAERELAIYFPDGLL